MTGGSVGTGGGSDTGGAGGGTGGSEAGVYNPEFVEFVGEDCTVSDPQTANNTKLPDLFANLDGSRMSAKSEWGCRRAEIKKVVEKFIHGPKPGTPDSVTGTVSKTSISVTVAHNGQTISFSVPVTIPAGATEPVPIIIGLGGVSDATIPSQPESVSMLKTVTAEGVATGNYSHNALSSETDGSGLFQNIYGKTGASAQVGWAWGISRVLDVLVAEKVAGRNDIIDPTAVGITGCSRNGKGAFTIGAFDERIALGIPQESGTGGVSALRIVNKNLRGPNGNNSESISSSFGAGPKWFGEDFINTYSKKVDDIPGDMHSLVAMYAPRGLLVLDNSRIGELGSVAQHAASAAGAEVFKALGAEKSIAYHGGNDDDPHNHCSFYMSQVEPLQKAIRAHLTRTAAPDGSIAPAAVATANMADWVDWTTPTLQ